MFRKLACIAALGLSWTLAGWGQAQPKKLSKEEAMAAVVFKPAPPYPSIARQLKIQGDVELEAIIGPDGTVEDVHIVAGNPVLTKQTAETVKKWKFTPIRQGDRPVEALAPISIAFKL